jgi:hypothetical protein
MEWNRRLAGILKVKGSVEFKLSVPNCNNFVSTFCVNLSYFFAKKIKDSFYEKIYTWTDTDTNILTVRLKAR